jgi:glycosyltransferase involved in cell wall biosynthesis
MSTVVRQMLSLDLGHDYALHLFPTTSTTGGRESRFARVRRHWRHLGALRRAVQAVRPVIVHIHTCSGISFFRSAVDAAVARRCGCRTVLHIHGAAFDAFCARGGRVASRAIRHVLGRADRVVALSKGWARYVENRGARSPVAVIENAFDPPPAECNGERTPDEAYRFLTLARMDHWKGVDDLLEAYRRLRVRGARFRGVLAGPEGSAGDRATLHSKIAAKGLSAFVRYVGTVDGADKEALLRECDVYVQASHHEGMPLAVLEALARGLPVVATAVGAVPEVFADSPAGVLVPPHRADLLAEAMQRWIDDPAARRAASRAARSLAEGRFTLDRLRDDLVALYDGLMAPERSSGTPRHAAFAAPSSGHPGAGVATTK